MIEFKVGDKMTFLEAMQALAEGKKVYNERCPDCIHSFIDNKILVTLKTTGYICTDVSFAHSEVQADWYIYEEQETVEWTPKKYESVLAKDCEFGKYEWELLHFENYEVGVEYPFKSTQKQHYKDCIPFKDNEHLLGTTGEPKVKYEIKEVSNEEL